jgi:hypothetical protein
MIGGTRRVAARSFGGRRRRGGGVALGVAAVLVLGGVLALRPAGIGPVASAAHRADLLVRAGAAHAALRRLAAAIDGALQEGRHGAAATVSGDDPPGAHFRAAAGRLEASEPAAGHVAVALDALRGELAIDGRRDAPVLRLAASDLGSIALQLRGTASPADAFAEMRLGTRRVLDELQAALVALGGGDLAAATTALDGADDALARVRAWPGKLATLPLWIATADRLLAALHDVADARAAGDAAGEARALAAYRAATADAAQADRALAIALAEGGGGISEAPMARLADALAKVEAASAAVAPLLHR